MTKSEITLREIETICRQIVASQPENDMPFTPTPNQVFFFMLVRRVLLD